MTVEERLRSYRPPEEAEAEERSRRVVQAAFEALRPCRRGGALPAACSWPARPQSVMGASAVGGGALAGALDDDEPELRSQPRPLRLPADGKLLVQSEQGPWVVRRDGSKRLLGRYDGASWSPRGPVRGRLAGRRAGRAGARRQGAMDGRHARACRRPVVAQRLPHRVPERRDHEGGGRRWHR